MYLHLCISVTMYTHWCHIYILYTNIDQKLVNSLHALLNCEIDGFDYRVITSEYRTRVHCIHMYHLFRNALVYVVCICPKYKMICLKSPKSSEFAIIFKNSGQNSLTMLILSFFNNYSLDLGDFRQIIFVFRPFYTNS